MLKVLFWLLWEAVFVYILVAWGRESGGYIFLFIACIIFFTWELIKSIKDLLKK